MSHILIAVVLLCTGFFLLIVGSNYFVDGASAFAKRLQIPQLIIGLTIVAMGTSLPEASVSIRAGLTDLPEIAVGNIVGSNIFNVLVILGLSTLVTPLMVQKSTYRLELPFLIIVTGILLFYGDKGYISRGNGVVFLLLFTIYLLYLLANSVSDDGLASSMNIPKARQYLYIIGGLAAIILGSKLAVHSATGIADYLGVSDRVISLTIVAAGTSLPELATSVAAARKKNADIAIGNIVGSNIFNILFILGITAIIRPIPVDAAFFVDTSIAALSVVLLLVCILLTKQKRIGRLAGLLMILLYGLYLRFLLS